MAIGKMRPLDKEAPSRPAECQAFSRREAGGWCSTDPIRGLPREVVYTPPPPVGGVRDSGSQAARAAVRAWLALVENGTACPVGCSLGCCPMLRNTQPGTAQAYAGVSTRLNGSRFVVAAVRDWQSRGRRFDPVQLHHLTGSTRNGKVRASPFFVSPGPAARRHRGCP